ncbi:MAG: HD-GYP domain-containing protein [Clostridiales bacterium]|nr:HD-GYP domain-containing protein [Clostridiales bacterium]
MSERALRLFRRYSIAVAALGVACFAVSLFLMPLPWHSSLLLLAAAAVLAENAALVLSRGLVASLAFPLSVAANVMLGPSAAGLVALCSAANLDDVRQRTSPLVVAFNTGQVVLAHVGSGWLYLVVGGRPLWSEPHGAQPFASGDFPEVILPLFALGVFASVANAFLVVLGYTIRSGSSLSSVWDRHMGALFPMQLSLTVVGVSIAQVMAVHVAGLALFLFPLLVSRQVYERYAALKRSYLDTVRSLVAALEAKDPYTAGHSERVAQYSSAIAKSLGLSDKRAEQLELAAQLHDLGKVGIPNEILSKPGRLTTAEFDLVRQHPVVGADLVDNVHGFADLVPAIRYHHERYDGQGYCAGLSGLEIPLEARILAVADSFDAMTSSRAYRAAMSIEEALAELTRCAGSQYDPLVVEHFLTSWSSVRPEVSS